MPKISDERAQARRQQIIDATIRCIGRKGFQATTIPEICKEAELSTGAVYGYFKSKEEILEACAADSERQDSEVMGALFDKRKSKGALESVIQFYFEELFENPGVDSHVRFELHLSAEALSNPQVNKLLAHSRDAIIQSLENFLLERKASGDVPNDLDLNAVAQLLYSAQIGMETQMALFGDVDTKAYTQALRALLKGNLKKVL